MEWKGYEEKYYLCPDEILEIENRGAAEIIEEFATPGRNCLDLGCGLGDWIPVISSAGSNTFGIDPCPEAIIYCCKKRLPAYLVIAGAESLPFRDDSFDFVIANWVLQEIADDLVLKKTIQEIARVLLSGGHLLITENIYPDRRKLFRSGELGDIFYNSGHPQFLRFFADNSIAKILPGDFIHLSNKIVGHSFIEAYAIRAG